MIPRSELYTTSPFAIVLLAMFGFSLAQGDTSSYWTEIISIALLSVPVILAWKEAISIPLPLTFGVGVALSLHCAGLVTQWYTTTDAFGYIAHFVSGIVVAWLMATFLFVATYYDQKMIIPVRWIPFFIFVSVLALEGFWKIFEFTADHTLGTMMQHGLSDTMNDNLSDTLAGIVGGFWVAAYVKRVPVAVFVSRLKLDRSDAWLRRRFARER
ncbi:MAG TPA: hypothetical protein VMB46_04290 [Methanomassiliicoccales archaeon]|nr:hypothetical protein [Methanomassiliicoccales archaeon]